MNIGIYIDSLADTKHLDHISNFINTSVENNQVTDVSLFYDDVGYVPFEMRCGIFNSVDMWNFAGHLITTSLSTINKAINIVNNIDLYYYHGWEQNYKVIDLSMILNHNPKIICKTEHDAKDLYRITGNHPVGITNNYADIINIIRKHGNEYSTNYKNVCRAE
jgi:hypothetical protein